MHGSFTCSGEGKEEVNESTKESSDPTNPPEIVGETGGQYNKLQHSFPMPLPEPTSNIKTNAEVEVAKEAPPSSTPLLDDYSTIKDVLEASSVFAKSPGGEMPGYEVIDMTQLKKKNDSLPEDSKEADTSSTPLYSSVNMEDKSINNVASVDEKKACDNEEETGLDRGGNEEDSAAVPLYSEVRRKEEEVSSGNKEENAEVPLYSEVNRDLSNSTDKNENAGGNDDTAGKSELDIAIQEMPLYSTVNMELKKSREALDYTENKETSNSQEVSFDDVLKDISKLADELPTIPSSPPPPVPPQLDLFTSPLN